jgi:hypothetical protein
MIDPFVGNKNTHRKKNILPDDKADSEIKEK